MSGQGTGQKSHKYMFEEIHSGASERLVPVLETTMRRPQWSEWFIAKRFGVGVMRISWKINKM